jgi:hypothetical protein
MKKIFALLIFVLLLVPALATAQSLVWYSDTAKTMAWDASPKVDPADDANRYQVVWRTDLVSTGTSVGTPITATQLALTIPPDVKYYFGVKAMRYKAGAFVKESAVAWSSDPASTNNAPWGFDTTRAPAWPGGLRVQ